MQKKRELSLIVHSSSVTVLDKVTKVARMLASKPTETDSEQKSCTVMALLDGGMLKRHKSWLKVLCSLDYICFSVYL